MAGTGSAVRWDADPIQTAVPPQGPAPDADASRADLYGGLVGDMIDELGQRLTTAQMERSAEPEDFAHRLSVAGGYLALAAGCLATALGISRLL
jgi:hypothetical protein